MAQIKKTFKRTSETIEVEVIEQVPGYSNVKLPNKHFYGHNEFVTVFQHYLLEIILKGNLNSHELKLLNYFMATMGEHNSVNTDLKSISEDLKMDKGNASKALKGLVLRNIVIRKDGNRYEHAPLPMNIKLNFDCINYNFAYNGKIKEHRKLMHQHPDVQKQLTQSNDYKLFEEAKKQIDGQP